MVSTHGYVSAHPTLGAEDTGGQVVYVLELSKQLGALGYDVDVWTRRFADMAPFERVDSHVRIVRVPCGGRGFVPKEYLYRHADEWCGAALDAVRRDRLAYDFVNSHYWDAGVMSTKLARELGVPHVHTPHSLGLWKRDRMLRDWNGSGEGFARKYNFDQRIAHERAIYADAALVVATSHLQQELLERGYGLPRGRLCVVPPGYDDERFKPEPEDRRAGIRASLGWPDEPTVLTVGRLARNKGYDLLVHAFVRVLRDRPRARLHLAVGGAQCSDDEAALQRDLVHLAHAEGISSRVTFAGYVPDALLPDTYRAADCFVLPSRYEPFGMTAVEAMACGTPAIVTCHGGLHRALVNGEHAMITDPHDAADLARRISAILGKRSLQARLRRGGRRLASSSFRWESVARRLVEAAQTVSGGVEASGAYVIEPGISPRPRSASARHSVARRPVRLIATDLDGTLLGNPQSALRFITAWSALLPDRRPILCFATGRTLEDVRGLVQEGRTPEPDAVVASVGTELWVPAHPELSTEFTHLLRSSRWDLAVVEEVVRGLRRVQRQPDALQNPFKSSWFLDHADEAELDDLDRALRARGVDTRVVYSLGHLLDVLPAPAGKDGALAWLCERLRLSLDEVVVAGDSGNDAGMFHLEGVRGIVVENAAPELFASVMARPVFVAACRHAAGLLAGLVHYGVVDAESPFAKETRATSLSAHHRRLGDPHRVASLSPEDRERRSAGAKS